MHKLVSIVSILRFEQGDGSGLTTLKRNLKMDQTAQVVTPGELITTDPGFMR